MERAKGIEPLPVAWKASILPLNYARIPSILSCLRTSGNEPLGSFSLVLQSRNPTQHPVPAPPKIKLQSSLPPLRP